MYSGKDWSLLYAFQGGRVGDHLGRSIAGLGDLNSDGYADLIVGAPQWTSSTTSGTGYVQVFSGKTGQPLFTKAGDAKGDSFGADVSTAGDVDRDGVIDIIVGATQPFGAGYARVLSGKTGSALHTFKGAPVTLGTGSQMGTGVCSAGDVDADGYGDVVVTSPNFRNRGLLGIGRIDVFSGRTGENLYAVQGIRQGDFIGTDVAFTGDVNKDGKPDFLAGSSADYNSRSVNVRSGSAKVYNDLTLATSSAFGAGCQSASAPISLTAMSRPGIGEELHVVVADIPRSPTGGLILLGASKSTWGSLPLPMGLGFMGMTNCDLLVSWDFEVPFFVASGLKYDWKVNIPYEPLLLGTEVHGQALILDAGANAAGIAVTHGLTLRLGG